jgi:Replication-relaxation
VLNDGDREILSFIKEFSLITREQLEKLTGRQTVWRRLRVKAPTSPLIKDKHVFFKQPRNNNLPFVFSDHPIQRRSEGRLDHELLITDIHIALYQTGYLVSWEQGKEAWKREVHQDAFAILRNPNIDEPHNKMHLFIEADLGTENHQTIAEKLRGYLAHPDKPFRTLFVTLTEARAHNLKRLAETIVRKEERLYFLFAGAPVFLKNPLAQLCLVPYENELSQLMPGVSTPCTLTTLAGLISSA